MRLSIQNAVAVDTPGGTLFGTASELAGQTIVFATHGNLTIGCRAPIRMELADEHTAVRGWVRIVSISPTQQGGPMRVVGELEDLDDRDGRKLKRWVASRQDPLNEPTSQRFKVHRVRPEPDGPTELRKTTMGRPSVAAAIRLGAGFETSSTPRGRAVPRSRGRPARLPGPRARVRLAADRTALLLHWHSWPDAASDWSRQIAHASLTVHLSEAPVAGTSIRLTMVLPDTRTYACEARVASSVRGTMTLSLAMSPELRRALKAALG